MMILNFFLLILDKYRYFWDGVFREGENVDSNGIPSVSAEREGKVELS